jgi:TonB family protein
MARPTSALHRYSQKSTTLLLALIASLLASTPTAHAQEDSDAPRQRGGATVTKAPELIKSVEAEYPKEALEKRIEGEVKLRIGLDATGKVVKVEVLEEPGAGLGEAAKRAAMQFEFSPAEVNGQPSAISLTFTVRFELPVQPGSFRGQILDATSGKPIEAARVSVRYTGPEALDPAPEAAGLTDKEGQFLFEGMPPGEYAVRLEIDQYQTFETSITVRAGQTSEATYKAQIQPVVFKGAVREAGTRKRLAGIRVEVMDTDGKTVAEAYTDAQGSFAVRGLPPGDYTTRVSSTGYNALRSPETIKPREVLEVIYSLEAEYYDPYTVRTTAKRQRSEVSRQTLALDEIRRVPGTNGDPVRVVQNLPGVARAPFGIGLLIIRGSNPNSSAVFLQGDQIPLVFHFLAGPSVVNSEMLQSIDFYPGNFSAYYGRATAGVIDLNTRSPREDGYHGWAKVDFQDAGFQLEGTITEDLTFALSGRRSYIDQVLKLVIPDDAPATVAPYYYDYQAWLTYRGFDDHLLELFWYGSFDELRVLFKEVQGDTNIQLTGIQQNLQFHRGQARWEWRPTQGIEHRLQVAFGYIGLGIGAGQFQFVNDIWTTNVREDLKVKISDVVNVRLGADIKFTSSEVNLNVPGFGSGSPDQGANPTPNGAILDNFYGINEPAFYVELETTPIKNLQLVPGLRADWFSSIKTLSLSPRLTGRYTINEQLALKGGVGLFTQPPDPQVTIEPIGNPELEPEKANQYAFGGEWRPLDYLELNVTGFYQDYYDLVTPTNDFEIDPDSGEPDFLVYNNAGKGRAYGTEVLLRHYPNNNFFGWISYTLSRSERRDVVTGKWELYEFDQTHIFTAIAGYNLPWGFDISARFQYVTGNPFTPIVGSVFDADSGSYQPIQGARNSVRNRPFNKLDIRIDKNFVFDAWRLGLYFDVQNVYWADNQEGVSYNYDFTKSQPINGLPIFPQLGITARF